MTSPATMPYRHIPENHGDLFILTDIPIGTHSCDTCVGVYLPLKNSPRAFCAHINSYVWSYTHQCAVRLQPEPEEIEDVKSEVLGKLFKNNHTMNWSQTDIDLERVVIVCPQPEGRDRYGFPHKRPSFYVIAAIMEYLGNPPGIRCDTDAQGFIVSSEGVLKIPKSLSRAKRDAGWLEVGNSERKYEMRKEECSKVWEIWTAKEHHMRFWNEQEY